MTDIQKIRGLLQAARVAAVYTHDETITRDRVYRHNAAGEVIEIIDQETGKTYTSEGRESA